MKRGSSYNSGSPSAAPDGIARLIGVAILVFALIVFASSGTYVVQPGFRGIAVTLGKVSLRFKPEGFGFKQPFVTRIQQMSVRQQTRPMPAECYSSDLQQVKMEVHVLYRSEEHTSELQSLITISYAVFCLKK